MMRRASAMVLCWVMAGVVSAQTGPRRAWQQRLEVKVPTAVPLVALEATNPFASPVDVGPALLTAVPPRKLPVAGRALLAAYVEPKGECAGAVPIELPFPGLTGELTSELMRTRFNPARVGAETVASWTVLEITLAAKVKESAVTEQLIELAEAEKPPRQISAEPRYSAGRLAALPAAAHSELTSVAVPKRLSVRSSGGDNEVAIKALVHVTEDGACDRFVPLEVPSGLTSWLSAFVASWRVEPARRGDEPVDCWLVYTARVRIQLGSISSTSVRVLPNQRFSPSAEGPSSLIPGGA